MKPTSTARPDCRLTEEVIGRHKQLFGQTPEVLAADKGFCPDAQKYAELEERVGLLAIPRRMQDLADAVLSTWQSVSGGNRGHDLGLKTGVSPGPLLLSQL